MLTFFKWTSPLFHLNFFKAFNPLKSPKLQAEILETTFLFPKFWSVPWRFRVPLLSVNHFVSKCFQKQGLFLQSTLTRIPDQTGPLGKSCVSTLNPVFGIVEQMLRRVCFHTVKGGDIYCGRWWIPSLSKLSNFLSHQVWAIWQQCLTFIWQWPQSHPS